jgi:hypothetical protein
VIGARVTVTGMTEAGVVGPAERSAGLTGAGVGDVGFDVSGVDVSELDTDLGDAAGFDTKGAGRVEPNQTQFDQAALNLSGPGCWAPTVSAGCAAPADDAGGVARGKAGGAAYAGEPGRARSNWVVVEGAEMEASAEVAVC